MSEQARKIEFGDFQTPLPLAAEVCLLLKRVIGCPLTVIEPSCGRGSFLEAAVRAFGDKPAYLGFDINSGYIVEANQRLTACYPDLNAHLRVQDFFTFNWEDLLKEQQTPLLFLGNPPWVTSASLGSLCGSNHPTKSNLKRLSGLSALTGKANFDISEWMLLKLAEAAKGRSFTIAMLCKTGVVRKALEYYWKNDLAPVESAVYRIDALKWFGAAVDACLFVARFEPGVTAETTTAVYNSLDSTLPVSRFGLVEGAMVSDVEAFREASHLRGVNYYRWRSGIKHDLAKVMELDFVEGKFYNGYGVEAAIEETHLYPLLKATDISKGNTTPTRYALVTQTTVGENTADLESAAPKTWKYLEQYETLFAERKSSIYRGQPKYCLFGVGPYSFAPYKVAVSGLHKEIRFTLIPPYHDRPVVLDDTGYFIGSHDREEATLLHTLFQAEITRRFLKAVVFADSKRPVTADVLNRIDVMKIAEASGRENDLAGWLQTGSPESNGQGTLVFEKQAKYRARK